MDLEQTTIQAAPIEANAPRRISSMMQWPSNSRRSRAMALPLSPGALLRRGEITALAFDLLGGRDGAIAFLNNPHEVLACRPLDLAIASEQGFYRVKAAIEDLAMDRE